MAGIKKFFSFKTNQVASFGIFIFVGVVIIICCSWLAQYHPKFAIFWYDTVAGLAGLGAISATIVALWLIWKTSQEVEISQRQVEVSQHQADVTLEQTKTLLRPVLFPSLSVAESSRIDFENPIFLDISNGGPGIAFNIQAVIFNAQRVVVNEIFMDLSVPSPVVSSSKVLMVPLYPQRLPRPTLDRNQKICGYTFAPLDDEMKLTREGNRIQARLVLTYNDVFNQTLCSIFDYDGNWISVYHGLSDNDIREIIKNYEALP